MEVLTTKGNTTDDPIIIDLTQPIILKEVLGDETDISYLFKDMVIDVPIDFSDIHIMSMEGCFQYVTFHTVDFTTLDSRGVDNLTDMVKGSNVPQIEVKGGVIYHIQCKEEYLYFYNDFYGTEDEFIEYLHSTNTIDTIDKSITDAIDTINRSRECI